MRRLSAVLLVVCVIGPGCRPDEKLKELVTNDLASRNLMKMSMARYDRSNRKRVVELPAIIADWRFTDLTSQNENVKEAVLVQALLSYAGREWKEAQRICLKDAEGNWSLHVHGRILRLEGAAEFPKPLDADVRDALVRHYKIIPPP